MKMPQYVEVFATGNVQRVPDDVRLIDVPIGGHDNGIAGVVGGLVEGLDVGLDDVGLLVLVELAVVVSTVVELELELEDDDGDDSWNDDGG